VLCFSHLRWNFVYQRPQHLLSRFGKKHRVIFFEEPVYGEHEDHYTIEKVSNGNVWVITPKMRSASAKLPVSGRLSDLLDELMAAVNIRNFIAWYYTPMALQFSRHLDPLLTVYDCMDELSAFRNAPPILGQLENELFSRAGVIFTGGHSLYEHKRKSHFRVHPFPSSIDRHHFEKARKHAEDPSDQQDIPKPRFGFYGVIDERFDLDLLKETAERRPNWQFILIGPVVKIDPSSLPRLHNIHYLGQKHYDQLPEYLAGWDVAIMPFARNESTKFISPTKTPEYLAGGKPVISTSVRDVVRPYAENGLVHIADTPDAFIKAAEDILSEKNKRNNWLGRVDRFLAGNSWDETWSRMYGIIEREIRRKDITGTTKNEAYV